MPFRCRLCAAAIAVFLVLRGPALAQIDDTRHLQEWEQCTDSDVRAAIEACTSILDARIDPPAQLAVAFNSRGVAHFTRGESDLALADLFQAIRLRPGYAVALNNRGTVYANRHAYDLAIADFTEALRVDTTHAPGFDPASTLASRGAVYALQGDSEHAIEDFTQVIQRRPTDAEAFFNRANARVSSGDLARALEDYERALALHPGLPGVAEARKRTAQRAGLLAPPEGPQPSLPVCVALPRSSPQAQPSYVDDAVDHLRKSIPELRSLWPEPADSTQTASIIAQTSAAIAAMLPRIPNLIAREEVRRNVRTETAAKAVQVPSGGGRGGRLGRADMNEGGNEPSSHEVTTVYTYRIVRRHEPLDAQDMDAQDVEELRTDAKNRPLAATDDAQNVGFGALWLLFAPANLEEAHFRSLGRQKIAGHETFVLSFVQRTDKARLGTVVGPVNARCNTFIQGVVWIDQASFHLIRMQTDLLAPIPGLQIEKIRSILKYSEVRIPERALSLWLPTDVSISWKQGVQDDSETHHYSKYRLFAGTARIVPVTDPTPP
ncbi:Tetratricopeptide repeat-containing protein [Granulicella pectinivorans]|uniref:Tetratricopeptide repeat-containing protein n=1 Tax=Granulicella pectinivorans TaxID=474950 RepID=A0A1I6MH63_9BACT|nr:tetratricopeptide repeat protein [Granulicella pectinivorans]SFS14999.1 Tetratricopeptide repeat-containing protein [Granulicella pectinivorans]